jgi:UDP-GlcNAc:undecaprenyl-phosphate GlcNAc-1-phosphate transferase
MTHIGIAPAVSVLAISLTSCYALTPVAAALARRRGWMDRPEGALKVHAAPVPRAGGLAMWLIMSTSLAVLAATGTLNEHAAGTLAIASAATFALVAGALDDARGTSPFLRLSLETLGSLVAVSLGCRVALFGGAAVNAAVSVVLLVGFANAFNLIDGIDGLASGLGGVAAMHLALLAAAAGDSLGVVACVILAGCCLGFLKHNLSERQKIFLGDGGSLFLGMTLSALAIRIGTSGGPHGGNDPMGVLIPFLPLAVPALDTSSTVARRVLARKPLFAGDRSHIYDLMIGRGISPRTTVLLLLTAASVIGAAAVALWDGPLYAAAAAMMPAAAATVLWRSDGRNHKLPSPCGRGK